MFCVLFLIQNLTRLCLDEWENESKSPIPSLMAVEVRIDSLLSRKLNSIHDHCRLRKFNTGCRVDFFYFLKVFTRRTVEQKIQLTCKGRKLSRAFVYCFRGHHHLARTRSSTSHLLEREKNNISLV